MKKSVNRTFSLSTCLMILPMYSFLLLGCDDDSYTTQEETQQEESSQKVETEEDITFHEIKEIDSDTLITDSEKKEISEKTTYSREPNWGDIEHLYKWYEIGIINAAPYKDWKLLVLDFQCDGPCLSTFVHRFAYNTGTEELVLLSKYSTEYSLTDYINSFISKFSFDLSS